MRRPFLALLLLPLAATPALAQAPAGSATTAPPAANAAVRAAAFPYDLVKQFVLRAAEAVPESLYAFKPTPEVRSFGQLVGHVADAQNMMCAGALGETVTPLNAEQSITAKAALVEALKQSIATCDRAYQQPDAPTMQPMTLFGMQTTRLGTLALNAAHSYEHYGNMVTYMRMNGMVPPSSARQ